MKVPKLFSLDYEYVQKLKQEDNASALVNSLIIKHYGSLETTSSVDEKLQENKEEAKKLRVNRLLIVKKGDILIGIPKGIIEDWENFPLMTEETMLGRIKGYERIYVKQDPDKLLEAFRAFR